MEDAGGVLVTAHVTITGAAEIPAADAKADAAIDEALRAAEQLLREQLEPYGFNVSVTF
jgi:hypothetical protein